MAQEVLSRTMDLDAVELLVGYMKALTALGIPILALRPLLMALSCPLAAQKFSIPVDIEPKDMPPEAIIWGREIEKQAFLQLAKDSGIEVSS